MYYANSEQMSREVSTLTRDAGPTLKWFCFDMAAVDDVDYSAARILESLIAMLKRNRIRPLFAEMMGHVRDELERDGILAAAGDNAVYEEIGDVLRAYGEK